MKVGLFATLFLSFLLFCGCEEAMWVHMTNNSMDNLEINRVGGHHVNQGEDYHVMTLHRDLPSGSFKICRGYGCLAEVKVAVEFPGESTQPEIYQSWIEITENPRDTFQGKHTGGWTAVVTIIPLAH